MKIYNEVSHHCSVITTELYSTSFSSAIKLLQKDLRDPIFHIYGFVRFADEIVDTFHEHDKETLLAEFTKETYQALDRKISLNPILHSFQQVVNRYNIDRELIAAFFRSMELDLSEVTYDKQGYSEYIYGSAEVVGLMCLYVFCNGEVQLYNQLKPYAQSLGAAFQKINFLRDIKADAEQLNRVYFPDVDFNHFTSEMKAAIEADIALDFANAYKGIVLLPSSSRMGVYTAYRYYLSLFDKIKTASPQQLLTIRIRVPNFQKWLILLKAKMTVQFNIL
jgi:phytoene/squalene synthetase